MKRLNILLFIAVAAMALTSCGNDVIYKESVDLPNSWSIKDVKTFEIPINNTDDCYNIYLTFDVDTLKLRDKQMIVVNNLYSENGERRTWLSYIDLKDRDGHWIYPFEDGVMKVDKRIREYLFFNSKGTHRLEIYPGIPGRYEVTGYKKMGVTIEKAELEYPE